MLLLCDDKSQFACEQESHLFVGVAVWFYYRVRLKFNERDGDRITCQCVNVDAWKNVVLGALVTVEHILGHKFSPFQKARFPFVSGTTEVGPAVGALCVSLACSRVHAAP